MKTVLFSVNGDQVFNPNSPVAVIGYNFHDFTGIRLIKRPIDPTLSDPGAESSMSEQ